jgi:glycosyltransferase 2 family protein
MGKFLRLFFFLLLGVFLVYYSVKDFSKEEVDQVFVSFKSASPFYLFLVFFVSVLSHIIRAVRWKIMLSDEKEKVTVLDLFWALMAGYLANLAFPRLGEVTRCGILKKYNDLDFSFAIGTVLFERIFDVICLFIALLLCLWIEFDVVYSFFNANVFAPLFLKLNSLNWLVLSSISVLLILSVFLALRFVKKSDNKLIEKVKELFSKFSQGFAFFKNVKLLWLFLLFTFGIWFFYYFGIIIGYSALPQMNNLGWGSGLSLLFAGAVAMIIVQGGIGAYPLALMQVLVLYNIDKSTGLAFGWLIWTLQTLAVLVLGAMGFAYFELKKFRKEAK